MRTLRWLSVCLLALARLSHADVWVADDHALYKVDPASGQIVSSITASGTVALAVDPLDGSTWTLSGTRLTKRSSSGSISFDSSLSPVPLDCAWSLAVDPRDRSVWIGEGKKVAADGTTSRIIAHLDQSGVLLGSIPSPGTLKGVSVALDQSIWILGNKHVQHFGPQGSLLADVDLNPTVSGESKLLAVDSIGAWVWTSATSLDNRLIRIDAHTPSAPILNLTVPKSTDALAVDETRGTVWVLAGKSLYAFDQSGSLTKTVDLQSLGVTNANTAAFDPVTRSILVGYDFGVASLNEDGAVPRLMPTVHTVTVIGTSPFTLETVLSVVSPASNFLTNNPFTPIVLKLNAIGSPSSANVAGSFYTTYTLAVDLNGQAIGSQFVVDGTTGRATFQPTARLPEGTISVSALATDVFGRASNQATLSFIVDTIPPSFIGVTPVGPVLTNHSPIRISGRLSESSTLTINSAPVPVAADLTFGYDKMLAEGLNTVVLVATDLAGNPASRSISITLDTVAPAAPTLPSITIGTPSAGVVSIVGVAGSVEPNAQVRITDPRTGPSPTGTPDAQGAFSAPDAAARGDCISIVPTDGA